MLRLPLNLPIIRQHSILRKASLLALTTVLISCGGSGSSPAPTPPAPPAAAASVLEAVISAPTQVTEYTTITLDGSTSTKPTGTTLTAEWRQISGPETIIHTPTDLETVVELPVVSATTNIQFELSVTDGTNTNTEMITISVAKTALPAPQGASPATTSFPQISNLTSIGMTQQTSSETGAPQTFVFVTRESEDSETGEILRFDVQTDSFVSFRADLEFPADIKAHADSSGGNGRFLFLTSESADRLWIFPIDDIETGSFETIDILDPCLVQVEFENHLPSGAPNPWHKEAKIYVGTRQGLFDVTYSEVRLGVSNLEVSARQLTIDQSNGDHCTSNFEGFLADSTGGFGQTTYSGALNKTNNSLTLFSADDPYLDIPLSWGGSGTLDILPEIYSDLSIIDLAPARFETLTVLASDNQKNGRHVLYELHMDRDSRDISVTTAYEWSEGLPTGLQRIENFDPVISESSLLILDPNLPYLRSFPEQRASRHSSLQLNGAPSFYESRFGIAGFIPYEISTEGPENGIYAIYDGVPGLDPEFRRISLLPE